jgi:predicted Zn-dependent protease
MSPAAGMPSDAAPSLPAVTVRAHGADGGGPGPLEHALMAARARVLGNPGVDVLRDWAAEPAGRSFGSLPAARRAASLYAAAMAHSRQGDYPAARTAAAQLAALVASDPGAARQARLLAAEVALEARRPADALQALGPMPSAMARPELLLWVRAVDQQPGNVPDPAGTAGANGGAGASPAMVPDRAAGTRAEAAQRLRTWVALHPRDATAWQSLGTLYRALGQPLHAVRADAEAQVALLDYAAAVDRFRAGQELVRRGMPGGVDHMEASIVDSRLREVEQMRKDWDADAKKEKY